METKDTNYVGAIAKLSFETLAEASRNLQAAMNRQAAGEEQTAEAIILPPGHSISGLSEFLPNRLRYTGEFSTNTIAAFADYVNRVTKQDGAAGTNASRVAAYVSPVDPTAIVYLNDLIGVPDSNGDDVNRPGRRDWYAHLCLQPTEAWKAVKNISGEWLSQKSLAHWLEEWSDHVRPLRVKVEGDSQTFEPHALLPAIELIRNIKIVEKSVTEASVQDHGASMSRMEEIEQRAKGGELPVWFTFDVEPYAGFTSRALRLRLQTGVAPNGSPTVMLRIIGLETVEEDIRQEFVDLVQEKVEHVKFDIGKFSDRSR